MNNSSSVYLKFASLEEIKNIMKQHLVAPFCIGKKKLNLCLVNKLPLDLNQKSRIVLVTIYNEKIKINVFTFYHLFKSYGEIKKIIIFKKKNYQIFIEFESAEKAHIFKDSLHNINYKNYFFIKIQFTQKKELVINQNSLFEYDFSSGLSRPFVPPVGPASFKVSTTRILTNRLWRLISLKSANSSPTNPKKTRSTSRLSSKRRLMNSINSKRKWTRACIGRLRKIATLCTRLSTKRTFPSKILVDTSGCLLVDAWELELIAGLLIRRDRVSLRTGRRRTQSGSKRTSCVFQKTRNCRRLCFFR